MLRNANARILLRARAAKVCGQAWQHPYSADPATLQIPLPVSARLCHGGQP